jgi:hypothetical protein
MSVLSYYGIGIVKEDINNDPSKPENDIEKRKPKPFRYISSIDEVTNDDSEQLIDQSVMTDERTTSKKLRENFESTIGVGDINTIEQVVKKHEKKRESDKSIDIT